MFLISATVEGSALLGPYHYLSLDIDCLREPVKLSGFADRHILSAFFLMFFFLIMHSFHLWVHDVEQLFVGPVVDVLFDDESVECSSPFHVLVNFDKVTGASIEVDAFVLPRNSKFDCSFGDLCHDALHDLLQVY
jgi:hypothetical protein